jgi:type I restriction enzyme S subunit
LDKIRTLLIPLPPRDEQDQILKSTNVEVEPVEVAIARTEREIALMQEYRTRLTADLVTGKLDVREAAAKLPEVEAEPAVEEALEELLEETELEESGE